MYDMIYYNPKSNPIRAMNESEIEGETNRASGSGIGSRVKAEPKVEKDPVPEEVKIYDIY